MDKHTDNRNEIADGKCLGRKSAIIIEMELQMGNVWVDNGDRDGDRDGSGSYMWNLNRS